MAIEEVGTRLVAQGEAQFTAAMKRAKDSVDGVNKSTEDSGTKGKKASSGLKMFNDAFKQATGISLTAAGAIGLGVVALKGLADYLGGAITAASDMNETLSKSKVVFGDSADAIEEMGDKAARAMGMSKQEAIAAAATYGNLFTSMDMNKQVSAEMSTNLVQLASDLASFNNLPTAEVLEKIRAGLVGEAEPLKSLGININEAALKQEALNLGLTKGKEPLNAAAKAQAAYSLMLKQSANAQGDFERTSDGAANQQRILEASSKDLAASIGEGLLPAWVEVLKVGNKFLEFLDNLINSQKKERAAITLSTLSYDKYYEADIKAIKATYGFSDAQAELYMASTRMTRSEYDALHSVKALSEYTEDEAQRAQKDLGKAIDTTTDAIDEQKVAQEALKQKMDELAIFMAGDVGKENEKYEESLQRQREKLDDIWFKIDALNRQPGGLTKEQKKEREDLLKDYDTELAKIKEIEIAHDKAMKSILANMLLVQLNYGGLTEDEAAFYLKTVQDWGLIDQATVDAWNKMKDYAQSYLDANGNAKILLDTQEKLADKTVTWTVIQNMISTGTGTGGPFPQLPTPNIPPKPPDGANYHWEYDAGTNKWFKVWGYAAGGSAASGHPIMVGEKGPELFMPNMSGWILSNERAMAAVQAAIQAPIAAFGRSVVYNQTYGPVDNSKHFDLGVQTSQSPQVVQRSFAQMKLLAG